MEAIGAHEVDRAEAPWIVQGKQVAVSGLDQKMVMRPDLGRIDSPTSRHAEMEDQRVAAIGFNEPIFGAAGQRCDGRASQPLPQIDRNGEAEIRAACLDTGQNRALQNRPKASDSGFDFGQFRH